MTSKLQRYVSFLLSRHFGEYTIRENIRPEWLLSNDGTRLELDFYIEELEIAIEVQGQQHYQYTPMFHKDYDDYLALKARDERKRLVCTKKGVLLYTVDDKEEAIEVIDSLKGQIRDYSEVEKEISDIIELMYWAQRRGRLRISRIKEEKRRATAYIHEKGPELLQQINSDLANRFVRALNKLDELDTGAIDPIPAPAIKRTKEQIRQEKTARRREKKEQRRLAQPDVAQAALLGGSAKTRGKARNKLHIGQLGGGFVVWGGEYPHFVSVNDGEAICDCAVQDNQTGPCSHKIRFTMLINNLCELEEVTEELMLVITNMRARLKGNESKLIAIMQDFERLQDAEWTEDQRYELVSVSADLSHSYERLQRLIALVPVYEPPTEHHESEDTD